MRLARQSERRPNGRSRHRASGERADRRGQRELQGFRRRLAEGHQRIALGAPEARRTKSISQARCSRPQTGDVKVTPQMAKLIDRYLVKNDYSDNDERITEHYHRPRRTERWRRYRLSLKPYAEQVFQLIDSVFSDAQIPEIDDDRKGQAESAERELREEGVPGALEPHQPQGGLHRRFRDRRADREVHQDTGQRTKGDAAAIHRHQGRAERRGDLRSDEEKAMRSSFRRARNGEADDFCQFRREIRPDRQAGRGNATNPRRPSRPFSSGINLAAVRPIQNESRGFHPQGGHADQRTEGDRHRRASRLQSDRRDTFDRHLHPAQEGRFEQGLQGEPRRFTITSSPTRPLSEHSSASSTPAPK